MKRGILMAINAKAAREFNNEIKKELEQKLNDKVNEKLPFIREDRKIRKYADAHERDVHINIVMFMVCSVLVLANIVILALTKNRFVTEQPWSKPYTLILGLAVIGFWAWIAFVQQKKAEKFGPFIAYTYALYYILIMLFTANTAYTLLMVPAVFVYMLHYDKKRSIRTGIGSAIVIFIKIIVFSTFMKDYCDVRPDELNSQIVLLVGLCASMILVPVILDMFNRDIFGAIEDKGNEQKALMQEVLEIADKVKEGAGEVDGLLNSLATSAEAVKGAVSEVSGAAETNTQEAERQSVKTKEIQNSVENTSDKAVELSEIAGEVGKEVKDGIEHVEKLKESTVVIEGVTNKVVTEMGELVNNMQEMRNFADTILSISNQTNLLALNASIESARAGEAGRGFAVVAEQIRLLSEQTKAATNRIGEMIENLTDKSRMVSDSINESVEATVEQTRLIEMVNENFTETGAKMQILEENVKTISGNIENLKSANLEIVDSISHLSASSEEIAAGSQNVTAIAVNNEEEANRAKARNNEVMETANQLNKYRS
jgi:methyl-accepting chemotaxis protein